MKNSQCCFDGQLVSVSELNGKKVIGAGAFTLGEVEGAELDTKKWQIARALRNVS
jgi:sporulation protein YlmC with PRC-barrel domain